MNYAELQPVLPGFEPWGYIQGHLHVLICFLFNLIFGLAVGGILFGLGLLQSKTESILKVYFISALTFPE
ncbi:hypothetical protein D1BOALGB6SA_3018 [Olavius sp. associated proteobacterium Delta 1]|nr:hypothetical protein D1BOALGB6SA_3018 [Olavius sp. associated proteobacterium Delta 1]